MMYFTNLCGLGVKSTVAHPGQSAPVECDKIYGSDVLCVGRGITRIITRTLARTYIALGQKKRLGVRRLHD